MQSLKIKKSSGNCLEPKNREDKAYLIKDIISHFALEFTAEPYGNGHINDTYVTGCSPRYILQRINGNVFKDPEAVMANIAAVCDFLKEKITEEGGDPDRETLTLMRTTDGKDFYKTEDGSYFRVYKFIEEAISLEAPENPTQFYNAAVAFGRFQRRLSDFPAEKLNETIVDFHNTVKRYENFEKAISENRSGRLEQAAEQIEFVRARKDITSLITDAIADGTVPLRVTHNDTKLNNVMLEEATGEGLCVIDLDTVMPGSLLYDFGDALRAGANTAAEDETDLSKVAFDLEMYKAFARGFASQLGDTFTQKEIELLPYSAIIMTLECGMRFLTDHLDGDTYFKIHRENHNLDRAKNQFKLVADMESKLDEMKRITAEILSQTK